MKKSLTLSSALLCECLIVYLVKNLLYYDLSGLDKKAMVLEIWLGSIDDRFFFYTILLGRHHCKTKLTAMF